MLDERPSAAELVAAVADFLDLDVRPALDGRLAFHAKVAANALRIVERELTSSADTEELSRLRALTGADGDLNELNALLAKRIRTDDMSTVDVAIRDHLIRSVLSRIAVDSPAYPSLREAAVKWPRAH